MYRRTFLAAMAAAAFALAGPAHAEDVKPPRVLVLTKSSGFQHSVITREGEQHALAERVLADVIKGIGGEATITKDASLVNAENLRNYDVVVFYTTGDLTQPGTDGHPPMGPNGVQELLDWINAGGGFVGFHCGCDTFHGEGDTITPYIAMIGGEFAGHGPQFFGKLIVVDKDHPAMKPFKSPYRVNDEWYYFKNLDTQNIHVLALLDSGKAAAKIGDKHPPYKTIYPIAWTKAMGEGRVFYNAMGHREDVWENPDFQQSVAGAITWANGDSALNAEPNYEAAMAQAPAKPEE